MAEVDESLPVTAAPNLSSVGSLENDTQEASLNNTVGKIPATPEGLALAYTSLFIMALLPIFFGSFRSIKSHEDIKKNSDKTGEVPETMSHKDAFMFPLVASCALFGLYIFFQLFSKDHVNFLLSVYFFVLGVFALTHMVAPVVKRLIPQGLTPMDKYHLELTQGEGSSFQEILNCDFNNYDLVLLGVSAAVGIWYFLTKHWIANNLFGLAFAINGVELLHLNKVVTGCILLGGLFFYDIFWVFGTNVMVTVAKSFDAPIKLVFPQDILENGMEANNMAMLGLGDIVIPGIFIALLLRYDKSLDRHSHFYFYVTFAAYIFGLATTMLVMHVFKHAQPALLYLVPSCLGAPILTAFMRNDLMSMFSYEDHPEQEAVQEEKEEEEKKGQ